VVLLRDMAKPYEFVGDRVVDVFMGIDIGSVSTNFVVIDRYVSVNQQQLRGALTRLFTEHNLAAGDGTVISGEYLDVRAALA